MPHDDRSIEVYLGGTHLCTAYPAQRLSAEQTEAFLENAARERKRLTAERRKASARARAELAPLYRGETRAEESRVLPPHAGDELAARRGDALLRRKARSNLLGLTDPTQPPQVLTRTGELMPQHFVNLPGAATLPTRQYQLTGQIIDDLIAESATGVVHGPAGTGKTYAVQAALERLRDAARLAPQIHRRRACAPVVPVRAADHAAGGRGRAATA